MARLGVKNSVTLQKLRTVFLSSLGGGLEFYDFIIFAIFASNISDSFFPATSKVASLIQSYGVFAIGYLIRPLGGIIFSHFGDKYGRKKSFSFSISLMAFSTLMMSLTPSYHSWGIFGTIIFIFFRCLQGISIGGEIPGAITFVSEHVSNKKGIACAVILLFLNIGILFGDLVHAFLHTTLSPTQFMQYGWRIAFLIGGVLAVISFYMRKTLQETQAFLEIEKPYQMPVLALFSLHKAIISKAFLVAGAAACLVSIFLLYLKTHLKVILGYDPLLSDQLSLIQLVTFMIASFVASSLSDNVSRKGLLIFTAIFLIAGVPAAFWALEHYSPYAVWIIIVNAFFTGAYAGVMPCFLSDLFPTELRYSGIAVSYNLAFAIFGGLTPLLSTLLIHLLDLSQAPALLVSISGLLAFISLLLI